MATIPGPQVSTLDEPVSATILRDLKAIGRKVVIVAVPVLGRDNELRDWDLWGPLLLCLFLAILLGSSTSSDQSSVVFSSVFVMIWVGSAVVTVNAKLLGANISFFQTVCVMGYCIAPLCLISLICLFVSIFWVKFILVVIAWAWSTYASVRFFRGSIVPEREALLVYPVGLFFLFYVLDDGCRHIEIGSCRSEI